MCLKVVGDKLKVLSIISFCIQCSVCRKEVRNDMMFLLVLKNEIRLNLLMEL